jgi:alanyl-tRNA synthetase
MKAQEIREHFLDYFTKHGHKVIRSSSLMPKDDPTLLFTNAGMNQFKNVFLGLDNRTYKTAASVQKCMRVSGKHNDLDQVGKTNKHHTFFEMLGNFSFGNYFKNKAIEYAWELVTEVLKIDKARLYITVYKEDDEAFQIWKTSAGVPEDRIFRFGKKDNYWAMGETGPCGPCSEIHIDLSPEIEEGDPYNFIATGSDRFLELWNLVFMQYYQDEKGNLHDIPLPSIDTGMGLERLATVLQNKKNNFDTDLFLPLIEDIAEIGEVEYPAEDDRDIALRVIADHIRAVTFLIGDGIMPSNDGRGYVLRRLIRRAFRQGNFLEINEPFLFKLVSRVADMMRDAYPELLSSAEYISRVCLSEEHRFALTLSSGIKTFHQYVSETKQEKQTVLRGDRIFKLYDTFGFPLDLSKELAEEENLTVDEEGFLKELEQQRQRARLSWKGEARQKERQLYEELKDLSIRYIGYESPRVTDVRVLALIKDGKTAQKLIEGEEGEIILDMTPYYAEAGGQVGDSGVIKNLHLSAKVVSAFSPLPDLISHRVKILSGKVQVGDSVEAVVDESRRQAISKNHTATHLLHAALRQTLGDHVKQSGSLVSSERLRFDFTHFAGLSKEELDQIEALVNEKVRQNLPVQTQQISLEEGIQSGAMAIFEEKYGEQVRMVTVDQFSKELCGGVHVHHTGEIGLFKIISETSIAAGMRRIEALTGEQALVLTQETENLLSAIQRSINSPRGDILNQIEKMKTALKEKEKDNRELKQRFTNVQFQKEDEHIQEVQGIKVLIRLVKNLNSTELRELADSLKQKMGSGVVILGVRSEKKAFLVISVSKDLTERIKANDLIGKMAPVIGGGGGGREDFAQAGGTNPDLLEQVLKDSPSVIAELLK